MLKEGIFFLLKDNAVISTVLVIQMPLYASLVFHVNCHCQPDTDWFLFHKLCNIKRQNLPYWNCNTDFVTRLVGEASSTSTNPKQSFSSGSVVPNMRLTKKLFHQGKPNSLVINQTLLMPHQDEPNSLVINQRVWFVLFVVNQFHRHIWLLGLSCLLATNFTVIFGCLVCLVCYQPISPNYHHYFQKR